MDGLLLFLSVLGILSSLVFAVLVFYLARLVLGYFRDHATDEQLKRFRVLRISDKWLGVLCAIAALFLGDLMFDVLLAFLLCFFLLCLFEVLS